MARAEKIAALVVRSWATLSIAVAAGFAFGWLRLADALVYDRAAIAAGQIWRLWTGHLVHLNSSHLFWDLAVFLPAGIWLECIAPVLTRWYYALTPLLISCLLWTCEPTLRQYAGLSGVATGLLVLLALVQTRRDTAGPRWFWPAVLLLVALKVIVETLVHAPLLVRLDPGIRTVPLAHVGGIACALIGALVAFGIEKRRGIVRAPPG